MTTRLAGKKTFFLPFNKGFNFGQGNPPNPGGHKSAYLWDEVLTRESLARIIQHFAKIVEEKDRDSGTVSKTSFFRVTTNSTWCADCSPKNATLEKFCIWNRPNMNHMPDFDVSIGCGVDWESARKETACGE